MNPQLSTLLGAASESDSGTDPPPFPARPDWRSRLAGLLPWLLLGGFGAVLATVLGERLLPARELEVATVVTLRTQAEVSSPAKDNAISTDPYSGTVLFQASGWIEPDPYPIHATALVDGVIDTVHVLEGERVKKGQLLATLIDDDAELDLTTAEKRRESLLAQCAGHVQQIALVEAEMSTLKKQVAVALARRAVIEDDAKRLESIPSGGVSEREVNQARLSLATQDAEIEALAAEEGELQARLDQLEEVQRDFNARIKEAETDVARKQLALDRTRIVSPVDGRILRLLASPGEKKMLRMDSKESATIAILYDPASLQTRIDVPLAEAAQLAVGQPVKIRTSLLPDRVFKGRVTRIVGEADLQRNTLQAKVAIKDPDDRLRPEMLCRAEFLAAASPDSANSTGTVASSVSVFIPLAALPASMERDSRSVAVWKVDTGRDRVVEQQVQLGAETRDGHRLVEDGLNPGDLVVLDPPEDLEDGARFRPRPNSATE